MNILKIVMIIKSRIETQKYGITKHSIRHKGGIL